MSSESQGCQPNHEGSCVGLGSSLRRQAQLSDSTTRRAAFGKSVAEAELGTRCTSPSAEMKPMQVSPRSRASSPTCVGMQ